MIFNIEGVFKELDPMIPTPNRPWEEALAELLQEMRTDVADLKQHVETLESENAALQRRVDALEKRLTTLEATVIYLDPISRPQYE